jgi:hypothetical protein
MAVVTKSLPLRFARHRYLRKDRAYLLVALAGLGERRIRDILDGGKGRSRV